MKKTGVEWNAITYGAYNKVRIFIESLRIIHMNFSLLGGL
jgi:hypothetical protein